MTCRTYGEVYVALNSISHELVAIKKVKMVSEKEQIESESKLLKRCNTCSGKQIQVNDHSHWRRL